MARPAGARQRRRGQLAALIGAGLVVVVVAFVAFVGSNPARDTGLAAASTGPRSSVASTGPSARPSASPVVTAVPPTPGPSPSPAAPAGRFGLGLLIADRGNGRLLIVNDAHQVLWQFPVAGSLPRGQAFSADDAFISPDGKTIVANDEAHQVIDRIDIVSRRLVWQFGHYNRLGAGPGFLHTPDDAYPLANGNIVVADIRNCRILEISPAKAIVREYGRAGSCSHRPPSTFNNPNGDTPLPDGGVLITEIGGSRVVRLDASGHVIFDIHAPVRYPSDAQLDPNGNVLIVDYANPGAILRISPTGHVLWRYAPRTGAGRLDHPSLAILLADGTIALNDDFRHRVIVIDPVSGKIVWQYGRTDVGGRGAGALREPDGIDVVPIGTVLSPSPVASPTPGASSSP